jgi:type VI protein secretion system component Hcp
VADNLPDVYLRFIGGDETDPDIVIPGDSRDSYYNGSKGWFTITGFGFGFGWGGLRDTPKVVKPLGKDAANDPKELLRAHNELVAQQSAGPQKSGAKAGTPEKKSGQLAAEVFSFTRTPSLASVFLIKKADSMEEVPMVELVVCRAAGVTNSETIKQGSKIPFLRFVFERVLVTECDLSVTSAPVPEESVKFRFRKVQMETVWTDNETGQRVPGGINRVTYNFNPEDKDSLTLETGK